MGRPQALLVTPLPPLETGLATYASRILKGTVEEINWTVAYTEGSDPTALHDGITTVHIDSLENPPPARFFQLGNSPHCFKILQALYRFGGAGVFHETHLHHMIRHCCFEQGISEEYRRELRFEYGPGADRVEKILAEPPVSSAEYDARLKKFPLVGRAVDSCGLLVCLNGYAASILGGRGRDVVVIGHPLDRLNSIAQMKKPGDIVIGMAGGFNYGRNLNSVIRAIELVREKYPAAVLLLAGGGYPEDLPGWVVSAGRTPEEEYQGRIRTMDIAVDIRHPSLGETSGSLLEIMRAGVPAVVSASGSFRELPSDAVVRVPTDNLIRGTASSIEMLLSRKELRMSMAKAACAWAENQGSEERMRSEWLELVGRMYEVFRKTRVDHQPLNRMSVSSAWHDVPPGFCRDTSGNAVVWRFSGNVCVKGPVFARGAWVCVWGTGDICGKALGAESRVIEIAGNSVVFSGDGCVSNIHWF